MSEFQIDYGSDCLIEMRRDPTSGAHWDQRVVRWILRSFSPTRSRLISMY